MTSRTLIVSTLTLALGGWVVAGCTTPTTEPDKVTDGDDDDGDDETGLLVDTHDTGDPTGGGGDYLTWTTMTFAAQFGFDQQNQVATSVFVDTGTGVLEFAPTLEVYLGDASWGGDLAQTDLYCTLVLPLDGAAVDATFTASDPRLVAGLLQDPAAGVSSDCFDGVAPDLDPALYGTDYLGTLHAMGEWGVGIGETEAYVKSIIDPFLTGPLLPEHLLGGTMRLGFLDPADVAEIWGYAWVVDGGFNAEVDENLSRTPNTLASVDLGNTMLQAWYEVESFYIYTFY